MEQNASACDMDASHGSCTSEGLQSSKYQEAAQLACELASSSSWSESLMPEQEQSMSHSQTRFEGPTSSTDVISSDPPPAYTTRSDSRSDSPEMIQLHSPVPNDLESTYADEHITETDDEERQEADPLINHDKTVPLGHFKWLTVHKKDNPSKIGLFVFMVTLMLFGAGIGAGLGVARVSQASGVDHIINPAAA